ncbi:IucA/IucC family protein [Streptomyces abyssomicinicus]|uniref:IucA/IucC family protein n=1 Tax=Streptomyces abyssomicinicus TaxID=574929 RepID=UPI003F758B44
MPVPVVVPVADEAASVTRRPGPVPDLAPDPVEGPDPRAVADAATVENLLRCWVRERRLPAPPAGRPLRMPLPATGTELVVPVRHWSPTGLHRFGPVRPGGAETAAPVDAALLAALLARETAEGAAADGEGREGGTNAEHGADSAHGAANSVNGTGRADAAGTRVHGPDLVARVVDSVRNTAVFLADRAARREQDPAPGRADLFLTAEQALLLGHPLHPTPKSREGLTDEELARHSPETRGAFPLHWVAVAPDVLAADSAWTERGRVVPAPALTARLLGPAPDAPAGHAPLPVHPWQWRRLREDDRVAELLDAGRLTDLGPHGAPWSPTSSVRTLYRTGAPAMLKLSLGLRITNSRRENLRKELHRGVEVHRLLRGGLGRRVRAAHPGFDIVRDPAWLAVDAPDGSPVHGLDAVIRHNPFGPTDDVCCVASLCAPRPACTRRPGEPVSRLAALVTALADRTGRPPTAVCAEWFLRYLECVVRPVLRLDGEAGIALEAHQQNTLLLLDADGWPVGGRYRDNQGYYFRASRRAGLEALLPGVGDRSDTFVDDDVTDERFAYYLGVNNVLGLIGAFGSQGLTDERLLLAAFRRFLADAATGPDATGSPLPARLLEEPLLRCKANLLTRLRGLDELVGPVDTQSVYVTVANPVHAR